MFKINGKKFFIGAALAAAVCFSACSDGSTEVTETSAETAAAAEEATSAEIENVSAVKPISCRKRRGRYRSGGVRHGKSRNGACVLYPA